MPSKGFTGDARLIQKAQQRKVQKYKLYSQYRKALKEEGLSGSLSNDHMRRYGGGDGGDTESQSVERADHADESSTNPSHARQQQSTKHKPLGAKKHSAVKSARKQWEQKQEEVRLAREAEEAAKEQVLREKAAAKKRRADQHAMFKKRNKRGQPVLGNQVDALLEKIKRGAA